MKAIQRTPGESLRNLKTEQLGSAKIRKTCTIVTRCVPAELLEHWLVMKWVKEDGSNEAYIKVTGRTFSIKRMPEEGYVHTSDYTVELGRWITEYGKSQRCRNTLRFDEQLDIYALSDEDYQEELEVESIARQHAKKEQEVDELLTRASTKKQRGKKEKYDWSSLSDHVEQGLYAEQIAEKVGCSTAAVRLQAKKQGLQLPRKPKRKKSV